MSDFKAKCTKFDIRLGLTGRAYSAPPDPLAGLGVGPLGKGKEGGERGKEGGDGKGRRGGSP